MSPITELMNVKDFKWTKDATDPFELIKQRITSTSLLELPDFDQIFQVTCYACKTGIGASLGQNGCPVAFYSEKLLGAQTKYTTYVMELYTVGVYIFFKKTLC